MSEALTSMLGSDKFRITSMEITKIIIKLDKS